MAKPSGRNGTKSPMLSATYYRSGCTARSRFGINRAQSLADIKFVFNSGIEWGITLDELSNFYIFHGNGKFSPF